MKTPRSSFVVSDALDVVAAKVAQQDSDLTGISSTLATQKSILMAQKDRVNAFNNALKSAEEKISMLVVKVNHLGHESKKLKQAIIWLLVLNLLTTLALFIYGYRI